MRVYVHATAFCVGPLLHSPAMKSLSEIELYAVVDEIREHLLAPGHSTRKWVLPSMTGDPHRAVSVVASRDLGEPGGDYMQAFHLSLSGWVDEDQVELPARDLDELVPLILDFLAPYAAVRGGDSNPFVRDASRAVHVWVYFASMSLTDPLVPSGPFAVTPWRAA